MDRAGSKGDVRVVKSKKRRVGRPDIRSRLTLTQFSLPADPSTWSYLGPEADDEFHDPDIKPRKRTGFLASMVTLRGAGNIGCLAFLLVVLIGLL